VTVIYITLTACPRIPGQPAHEARLYRGILAALEFRPRSPGTVKYPNVTVNLKLPCLRPTSPAPSDARRSLSRSRCRL